jgi:hypothetical protein
MHAQKWGNGAGNETGLLDKIRLRARGNATGAPLLADVARSGDFRSVAALGDPNYKDLSRSDLCCPI